VVRDTISHEARSFIVELDATEQWHIDWSRRVLRCAVLRAPPGDEVLAVDASRRCRLWLWLQRHRGELAALDAAAVADLQSNHDRMHWAARRVCERILDDETGDAETLGVFEQAQAGVIAALARLKTAYLACCARLDALTGLPLRHGMEAEFERCRARAQRHGELLVLLLLDLDEFKRINDSHGHAVGDLALQHCTALLQGQCRAGEPLFRVGGEEFLALLQVADRATAQRAAERILQALRDQPMTAAGGETLSLRASAGLAEAGRDEAIAAALDRADRALYAAKAAGRDTWRWAPVEAPS
jgi:diguanylate cyclase (GGDEF)-like protein